MRRDEGGLACMLTSDWTYVRDTIEGAALRSPMGVSSSSMAFCSSSFL